MHIKYSSLSLLFISRTGIFSFDLGNFFKNCLKIISPNYVHICTEHAVHDLFHKQEQNHITKRSDVSLENFLNKANNINL